MYGVAKERVISMPMLHGHGNLYRKGGFSLLFLLGGFLAYDTFGCPVQPYTCFGVYRERRVWEGLQSGFTWSLSSILAEDSVSMPPTAVTTFNSTKFLSPHHVFLVPRPRSQFLGGDESLGLRLLPMPVNNVYLRHSSVASIR